MRGLVWGVARTTLEACCSKVNQARLIGVYMYISYNTHASSATVCTWANVALHWGVVQVILELGVVE